MEEEKELITIRDGFCLFGMKHHILSDTEVVLIYIPQTNEFILEATYRENNKPLTTHIIEVFEFTSPLSNEALNDFVAIFDPDSRMTEADTHSFRLALQQTVNSVRTLSELRQKYNEFIRKEVKENVGNS